MKKLLHICAVLIGTVTSIYAQGSFKIEGTLLDENSKPLPFSNVLLLKAADSTLVKGVATNENGIFEFESFPANTYIVSASMMGYEKFSSPSFTISTETPTFSFQPIKMKLVSNQLKEVTVAAKKPFIEQQVDKTVVNVENSIVASGNSALEVLEKAPGVIVDQQNDQIKLKNKSGVLFMIDGKRNYLSEADLVQFLKNMTSDQIASIEIITNPSSKYDASGNSGIINIKLKKNQSFGTNGSISTTAGTAFIPNSTGDLTRGSASLNLNYRNKKWNIYGTSSGNRGAWYNDNQLNRKVNFENSLSTFNQYSERNGSGLGNSTKIGVDYFASTKTTVGIMLDGNYWDGTMVGDNTTKIQSQVENLISKSSLAQSSEMDMGRKNLTSNFNIKHNFDEKGKELTVDIDYSGFNNSSNQFFNTNFFDANDNITSTLNQRNRTPNKINIIASKIDFTLPLEKKVRLEMGAKSSYVKTDNNFVFEQQQDGGWVNDKEKSNYFIYKENVNAAYLNINKSWEKWSVQAGLRAEHTNSNGNSVTLNKVVARNYVSLFPTFFLNQTINKDNSLRYSYSRRIDRPNYEQLNPFLFFLDPYTYEEGNPFLQPQFTDNYEVTYTYKGAASLALGYSNTHDYMAQITEQDDATKVTKAIQRNLERFENYSANLSFPVPVRKWWMMQNQVSFYYNRFKDDNLLGGQLNIGAFAYNFYTSSLFTLPKNWTAEMNMWYNSPSVYGMFRNTKPQYAINAGIQKSFWEKKGRLKLNANDLFLTSFWNGAVKYQNMDFTISNRWTSRRVSLTFSYNFGNQNVKSARRRSTATDSEKQRVGGNQN